MKDDSPPAGITLGEHVVLRLTEPYRKTGRNVTADNFFTSVNLAKTLRQEGISIVGTVYRIRKEIAQEIKKERTLRNKSFQTRWLHLDSLSSENHKKRFVA